MAYQTKKSTAQRGGDSAPSNPRHVNAIRLEDPSGISIGALNDTAKRLSRRRVYENTTAPWRDTFNPRPTPIGFLIARNDRVARNGCIWKAGISIGMICALCLNIRNCFLTSWRTWIFLVDIEFICGAVYNSPVAAREVLTSAQSGAFFFELTIRLLGVSINTPSFIILNFFRGIVLFFIPAVTIHWGGISSEMISMFEYSKPIPAFLAE